jgi:predicted ArsR family transcriptional regulator
MAASSTATMLAAASESLVRLLGRTRAEIVTALRDEGERTVTQLAEHLGISEVATRRHLSVLEDEGFVTSHTVKQAARGRPASWYDLTEDAQALFPHRYDRLASEVLDFLTEEHGRAGLRAFLRWRLEREEAELRRSVTAEDLHERLGQLADALSEAGFAAEVEPGPGGFTLVQNHCTIADVAKEHPEVCAYEAAAFSKVLGQDVNLSRRETMATGATTCVCTVKAKQAKTDDHAETDHPRTNDQPSPERAGEHQ